MISQRGSKGEYNCPACDTTLEKLDGEQLVVYRLTIQPKTVRAMKGDGAACV